MIDLPTTIEARQARIRHNAWSDDDLAWLRATVQLGTLGWAVGDGRPAKRLVCDCRCRCHSGPCGYPISLEVFDCARGCRSAHILASECQLDETRGRAHV